MKMLKTVNVVVSMVQIDKVMLQIACVIFLTLSLVYANENIACDENDRIKNSNVLLCLPLQYTKLQAPAVYNKSENTILVHPFLEEISDIDEQSNTITLKMFLAFYWKDSRIILSEEVPLDAHQPINLEIGEQLWLPDPDIEALDLITGFTTGGMGMMASLKVNGKKEFRYSQRLTIRVGCVMDLKNFPHDKQVCNFKVGSYAYDTSFVNLQLYKEGSTLNNNFNHPNEYIIEQVPLDENERILDFGGIKYAYTGTKFRIKRRLSTYVSNYYAPTGLFVVIAWVNFVIPTTGEMLLGRLGLLITLFLVLITIFNSAMSSLPSAEESTYLEVWMISCIIFCLGVFLQTTFIIAKARFWRVDRRPKSKSRKIAVTPAGSRVDLLEKDNGENLEAWAQRMDLISFLISLAAFIIFNIFFWTKVYSLD